MKKILNWLKVALAIVFSVLVYIFFTHERINVAKIKKKTQEIKAEAKVQEKIAKKIEKRIQDRKTKAKELTEKLKKHFNIFVIVAMILFVGIGVTATNTIQNLKAPETYNELLIAYKDMAEIAIGYQNLYNEAEQDNQTLLKVVENLQALISTQQDIINELLKKNKLAIFTGFNYVPLSPQHSGLMAGVTFEF